MGSITYVQYSLLSSSEEGSPTSREVQEREVMVWKTNYLEKTKAQGPVVQHNGRRLRAGGAPGGEGL